MLFMIFQVTGEELEKQLSAVGIVCTDAYLDQSNYSYYHFVCLQEDRAAL